MSYYALLHLLRPTIRTKRLDRDSKRATGTRQKHSVRATGTKKYKSNRPQALLLPMTSYKTETEKERRGQAATKYGVLATVLYHTHHTYNALSRYDSEKTVTLDKEYVPELDLQEADQLDAMILNCLQVRAFLGWLRATHSIRTHSIENTFYREHILKRAHSIQNTCIPRLVARVSDLRLVCIWFSILCILACAQPMFTCLYTHTHTHTHTHTQGPFCGMPEGVWNLDLLTDLRLIRSGLETYKYPGTIFYFLLHVLARQI